MLESLNISNYALIDKVEIEFHPGLNIITGETGAGKSIMLGALNLLLGGRADSKAVRHADTKSVIEASFTVDDYQSLKQFCLDNDIEWDDERCILRREISPTGRSRAFINDSPVPLSKLEAVGCRLIDIHSQHQNQLLAREDFQLQVIDSLAGNSELLGVHAARFESFRRALHTYKVTKARFKKTRDDEEYTRYQLDQLNDLRLGDPNEQTELEQRREVLENLTVIKSELNTVLDSLFSGGHNALDLIATAQASCEELASLLPPDEQIVKRLEAAYIDLKDVAETVSAVDSSLMADPAELEDIERRLSDIYAMEQRHKVDSTAELIELRNKLATRLDALDGADETLASLEKEARRARDLAKESAAEL
ncbi:MAG: AAA family ATPase, partial [Paramuribaculum sp.]|nr:AAA family ATPase [Paramuribaculum sp.]